jgi:hypothetical protein
VIGGEGELKHWGRVLSCVISTVGLEILQVIARLWVLLHVLANRLFQYLRWVN